MPQISRMDIRIPLYVKATIDFAAALEGRTRTDFLIEAAVDKARKVIAENRLIELYLKDQQMLVEALTDDSIRKADCFMKDLADKYRDVVRPELAYLSLLLPSYINAKIFPGMKQNLISTSDCRHPRMPDAAMRLPL